MVPQNPLDDGLSIRRSCFQQTFQSCIELYEGASDKIAALAAKMLSSLGSHVLVVSGTVIQRHRAEQALTAIV